MRRRRPRFARIRPTSLGTRVLRVFAQHGVAMTCYDIAGVLGENAKSIYAAMSTMGRYGQRWWIMPANQYGQWRRNSRFQITKKGMEFAS